MKIQKNIRLSIFIVLMALFLNACGTGQPPTQASTPVQLNTDDGEVPVQIILYTPKAMLDDNVISEFNEQTSISIVPKYYTTDEELLAMVGDSPGQATLIVASNYAASTLHEQNQLALLNPTNIPNLNNIDSRFRNLKYDFNNQFCAPYAYNTIGIGYINGQGILPTSWGDLFRLAPDSPAYGRTTLLNHPREVLGAALIHLGYDPNTVSETEVAEAKQLVLQAASSFDGVDSIDYGQRLATFQTSLAQGVSREFLQMQQVNSEMNYAYPEEGALLQIYSLCVSAFAPSNYKKAAEIFVNLVLDPAWVPSSVFNLTLATTVMIDESEIALDAVQTPIVFPSQEILDKAQYLYSLGPIEIIYTTAWKEITDTIR